MNAIRTAIGNGAVAILIAVGLAGCGKDNPIEPKRQSVYPALDTPQHVLLNVKAAWERRDSVRTARLYDDDYQGTAPDPDRPQTTFTFHRQDEINIVRQLHDDPDVVGTFMELRAESTWVQLHNGNDPPEYTTIQLLKGVALEVFTTSTTHEANISTIEYTFKPYVAGSDTTWKIIRWSESF